MTLLETKANEVISKLRECSELKSPSGRSRNEILNLLEQLREIANKYTGRGSLFEIFLSYNITLAEAFCSLDGTNALRLEDSLLAVERMSPNPTHLPNSHLQIVACCTQLLNGHNHADIGTNIIPVWLLSTLLMKQRRWSIARSILKGVSTVVPLDKTHSDSALTNLLSIHYYLLSVAFFGANDMIGAAKYAELSIAHNPENLLSISLMASLLAHNGGSMKCANTWLIRLHKTSFATSSLGYALAKYGLFPDAIKKLRTSLATETLDRQYSLYNLSILYGQSGDTETMKKLLQLLPACFDTIDKSSHIATTDGSDRHFRKSSLRVYVKDAQDRLIKDMSKFLLGRINAIECKWAEACLAYKQVRPAGLKLLPSTEYHYHYARALLRSNKIIEAESMLLPIFELDPFNANICELMVEIYVALRKPIEALNTAEKVLTFKSKLSRDAVCRVYNNKAMVLTYLGQYLDALVSINEAIKHCDHSSSEPFFNRSFLYIRVGKIKEAALSWARHRNIKEDGNEKYYSAQLQALIHTSKQFEDSTAIFCEGK